MKIKIAIFLFTALAFLTSCGKKAELPPPPIPSVKVALSEAKAVPYYLEGIGSVQPYSTVKILARVTGQLIGTYFEEGSEVKTGDLLFTIDPRPYEATYHEDLANLAQAKAQAEYDKLTVKSYEGLLQDRFVAPLQFQQYVSNAEISKAQVEQQIAASEVSKLNVEYCYLYSPIDGKTGKQLVDTGNMVFIDQNNTLVTINQITPIYIDFTIPETQIPLLFEHAKGQSLTAEVLPTDDPNKIYMASLVFIDNQVSSSTGTLALRAEYPNKEKDLWPGQFANIRLRLYEIENAVLVPTQAIQLDTKGCFVFVIGKDNVTEKKPVTIGQRLDDKQVILSGLQGGEKVVIQGQLGLNPGTKVQIK